MGVVLISRDDVISFRKYHLRTLRYVTLDLHEYRVYVSIYKQGVRSASLRGNNYCFSVIIERGNSSMVKIGLRLAQKKIENSLDAGIE